MKKAFIVGIDSSIGSFLQKALQAKGWAVFGTSRQEKNLHHGVVYLDLLNVQALHFQENVDVVFLCASMTTIAACQASPEICKKINLEAQIQLAETFLHRGAHIVFLSTSAVFSGEKRAYQVNDAVSPASVYGETKAMAEHALLQLSKQVAIVRLTKVLTPTYPLICQWIEALKRNAVITPFHDLTVCPISINTVTACLKDIGEKQLPGIMHLSGERDVSYQTLAEHIAKLCKADKQLIQPQSARTSGVTAKPGLYSSLDMSASKNIFNIPDTSLKSTIKELYPRHLGITHSPLIKG